LEHKAQKSWEDKSWAPGIRKKKGADQLQVQGADMGVCEVIDKKKKKNRGSCHGGAVSDGVLGRTKTQGPRKMGGWFWLLGS